MAGVFHVVAISIIRFFSLHQLSNMNSNTVWFTYQVRIDIQFIITRLEMHKNDSSHLYFGCVAMWPDILSICEQCFRRAKSIKIQTVSKSSPDGHCLEKDPKLAGQTTYQLTFSDNEQLHKINFWWFGSIAKLVPCFILVIMTILILRELGSIRQMSARFNNAEKERQHTRTTKIILVQLIESLYNLNVLDRYDRFYRG